MMEATQTHTPPNGSMPELRRVGWGLRLCKNGHQGPRGHLHISHRQGLSREPGKTPSSQEMVLTCGQGRQSLPVGRPATCCGDSPTQAPRGELGKLKPVGLSLRQPADEGICLGEASRGKRDNRQGADSPPQ